MPISQSLKVPDHEMIFVSLLSEPRINSVRGMLWASSLSLFLILYIIGVQLPPQCASSLGPKVTMRVSV